MEKLIQLISDATSNTNGFFENLSASAIKLTIRTAADNVMSSGTLASLYSAVIPIALILIVIGFAMQIMEMAIDQQFSVDKFIKNLIILIIFVMILDNGVNSSNTGWIQKGYQYSKTITDEIVDTGFSKVTSKDKFDDSIKEEIEGDSGNILGGMLSSVLNLLETVWNALTSLFSLLLYSILNIIVLAVVYCIGMLRAIKLGIYVTLAPISIAASYSKSPFGIQYLKKILVLFVQELAIILSAKIIFAVQAGSVNPIGILVLCFTLISAVCTSENKAKELLR